MLPAWTQVISVSMFIVTSGVFKLTLSDDSGNTSERILKKDDHGGDQVIQAESLTLGKLEAIEQGELIFLNRKDFRQLCKLIPVLNAHLKVTADQGIKDILQE